MYINGRTLVHNVQFAPRHRGVVSNVHRSLGRLDYVAEACMCGEDL